MTVIVYFIKQQKKHIIIASYTQPQAKLILENIKSTLETNELLISDHGKFKFQDDTWNSDTLILPKYETRISMASTGSTIRGARHKKYRPGLIILDDIESLESVKNKETRDSTAHWLERDVIPAGDRNTNVLVLGNLLHRDDLINRLINKIDTNQLNGKYLKVPLVDEDGNINWIGKYPNMDAVKKERKRIGDEIAFKREFLLKIVDEADQVITNDMFQYYDSLPDDCYLQSGWVGVDLAISQEDHNDKTAVVGGYLYRVEGKNILYILPAIVNKNLNFQGTIEEVTNFVLGMKTEKRTNIFIENVGYQTSFTETMKENGFFNAGNFQIKGRDKRQRLATIVHPMSIGIVKFPKYGVDVLRDQLLSFGVERYDDLVDALSMLVIEVFERTKKRCNVIAIPCTGRGPAIGKKMKSTYYRLPH